MLLYKDGKGKSISAKNLGSEFITSGVSRKINANAQVEQDREAIAKSQIVYETMIARRFADHKGSATEFLKYVKSIQPDDIEVISKIIRVEYIRHRLQTDINKNEIQLAADRDRLRREGHDVGKKLNRGLGM